MNGRFARNGIVELTLELLKPDGHLKKNKMLKLLCFTVNQDFKESTEKWVANRVELERIRTKQERNIPKSQ